MEATKRLRAAKWLRQGRDGGRRCGQRGFPLKQPERGETGMLAGDAEAADAGVDETEADFEDPGMDGGDFGDFDI